MALPTVRDYFERIYKKVTTDTVEKTEKVFDVPTEQKNLASLKEQISAKYIEIAAAVNSNDLATMGKIGSELGELIKSADKLEKKINRTISGVSTDSTAKITARTEVFNKLTNLIVNNVDGLSDALNAFRSINPSLQQVRIINNEDGTWGFDSVGGIRVVTKSGIKRPRSYYTGKDLTADKDAAGNTLPGASPKTVVGLFSKKYGNSKSWNDLTGSERNALITTIVEGEKFEKVTK